MSRLIRLAPCLVVLLAFIVGRTGRAEVPLHERIDTLIEASYSGPWAEPADDAEFLRRVYLDLAGYVPPAELVRSFLADADADKRLHLIDRLIAEPEYADRLADAFSVMLLERRDGGPITELQWRNYLADAFRAGKTWDHITREILSSDGLDPSSRPAMRFYITRGANSYDLLTRDLGRLFLGMDLQCAQCHDHPSIQDYKQSHYFGIFAFVNQTNTTEAKDNKELLLVQKGLSMPVKFESVFTKMGGDTGPQLPGRPAVEVPGFAKPEEAYVEHPRIGPQGTPKFNVRDALARELTSPSNTLFARNFANRLWAITMGRGLVVPLDLHHAGNPPSHPELMELLTAAVVEHRYDVRTIMRELLLTKTYARSSLLPGNNVSPPPETFANANMRPLSPEQLMESVLRATGERDLLLAQIDEQLKQADAAKFSEAQRDPKVLQQLRSEKLTEVTKSFLTAFANPPGEAEDEFNPTLSGALFFENDQMLSEWLTPKPGNLIDRLSKMQDPSAAADELYLSILSRFPTEGERLAVSEHLSDRNDQADAAWSEIAWGLLASSEFRLNH